MSPTPWPRSPCNWSRRSDDNKRIVHSPASPLNHTDEKLRQRLLQRIRRRYEVIRELLQIGALQIDFTRIADPDHVLDMVADEADRREKLRGRNVPDNDLHLPYWAELWDSAMGIARYLQRPAGHALLKGTGAKVLDLGCGQGLSGTVAAALGASVTFADLERPALLMAALNSLPWRDRVRTRQLNWQLDKLPEKFDLIIGADILYERAQWVHLEPFWRAHLADSGAVLLGEPGRQTGDMFIDQIRQKRWTLELTEEKVTTRPAPIRILTLRPVWA